MTPPPIGLIRNPRSHGAQGRTGEALRALAAGHPGVILAEPATRDALRDALAGFAAAGLPILAVSGGDGTLREVLTALPTAWTGPAPAVALLPAGKTDLAAGDVGGAGRGARGLGRLLDALERGAPLRRETRPVLEVDWPGEPQRRLRGFLCGAAAFAHGHRVANQRLHPGGAFGNVAVGLAVAAVLGRALLGGGGALAAGEAMRLRADGAPAPEERHFLVLATTLERLPLGLWPFREAGQGPLHWLDVAAPPRQLLRALWEARRGRPGPPRPGHAGGRAARIELAAEQPFVLDGEAYAPGPGGVVLSAPTTQVFVSPP
ncbi:diacylglycerol kinase family protein [Roseomonas sp. BN140053]|uniref:diacylglycerol kinase family protein n=1 Tax=Roseomonas sp. BN140053 TaxID=3391898 RepID=UPI0039E9D545